MLLFLYRTYIVLCFYPLQIYYITRSKNFQPLFLHKFTYYLALLIYLKYSFRKRILVLVKTCYNVV